MVALAGGEQVAKPALSFLETHFHQRRKAMRHSKKLAVLAVAAGVAITATAAFGWWSSSGTGSGAGTAGSSSEFEVTSSPATGDPLSPGGPIQTIAYSVKNNNSGHQIVQSVEISVATNDGSAWSSGSCDADDFSVGGEAAGASHTVTPNDDLGSGESYVNSVTLQMVNLAENQDDCEGVTVPLFIDAS